MKKLSIYLSGPITEVSEGEAWGWRTDFKDRFGNRFDVKNPLDRDHLYQDLSDKELYSAVANDERIDILNCDAIIAMINYPSMGTAMGIMYAYLSGRTVVVVKKEPSQKLSKMVLYHAHKICNSLDDAVDFIESRHNRSKIKKVIRRDGTIVDWDPSRIENAIQAAINDTYPDQVNDLDVSPPKAAKLATTVIMQLEDAIEKEQLNTENLNIELIQDMVEKVLMDNAHRSEVHTLSKAYIIYRRKRQEYREKHIDDSEIHRFLNEILHDFKSPVANIRRNCEFLEEALDQRDYDETRAILKSILSIESDLENSIVRIKAKSDNKYQKCIISINDTLQNIINNYSGNKNVSFHLQLNDDLLVESPLDKIETIFTVLIDNSIKHGFGEGDGNIFIKVHQKNKRNLRIQYWNDKNKITKRQADTIFFGKKRADSGSLDYQFGLTQIRSYVEQLAGNIECVPIDKDAFDYEFLNSSEVGFPVFLIDLPIFRGKSASDSQTILIADDNPHDRDMIRRILSRSSFATIDAESIDKAHEIARETILFGAVIDVDFKEDRDGLWLLRKLMLINPSMRVIVVSGMGSQTEHNWQEQATHYGALDVFDKSRYTSADILRSFSQ